MYIEPNSLVYFLHTRLNPDYQDTIYFDTRTAQAEYFINAAVASLPAQTYTRVRQGVFRCSLPMSTMYNVNYMMFKNTGFENKWFYAFVTSVEYINNGLCEVRFSLDVFQTWFTGDQIRILPSQVVREHVTDDTIGANIASETLQTGEYVCEPGSYSLLKPSDAFDAVILAVVDVNGDPDGKLYDRTYGSATLYAYAYSDTDGINAKIKEYQDAGKPDAIINMYIVPGSTIGEIPESHILNQSLIAKSYTLTEPAILASAGFDDINGNKYVPKNNKCYTYPFNFCRIITGQGNQTTYRYEFFKNLEPKFLIQGNTTPPISQTCLPSNYKGYSEDVDVNEVSRPLYSEAITVNGFPFCSWNYDTYVAWLAQNSVPMENARNTLNGTSLANAIYNAVPSAISGGMSGASTGAAVGSAIAPGVGTAVGGAIGAVGGAILSAAPSLISSGMQYGASYAQLALAQENADYTASIAADTSAGTANGSLAYSAGILHFYYSRWHCTVDRIKAIDSYFSMFGYAVNQVKVPEINSRPHWNYVQVNEPKIIADMPADDMYVIKRAMEHGIRFWKNGDEIGNFELDNSIS